METKRESGYIRIKRLAFLLLLIYLALGLVAGGLLLGRLIRSATQPETSGQAESSYGVGLTLDPDAADVQPQGNNNGPEQDVTIAGMGAVTVPANRKEVSVDFYNPNENAGLYYLTFELRLCNDSPQGYEVLYTSGFVDPGKHIYQIKLSRALETGVYDAVIHIQPYRMDQGYTLTNNADIVTRLIVR